MLTKNDKKIKRVFDIILSVILLYFFSAFILILLIISFFQTKSFGFFKQIRIGENGSPFYIYKIRTMNIDKDGFVKIKRVSRFLRKYKLDELPQLINILKGEMSFVGPRPDIPGFADQLQGKDRIILSIKPGLTGPASLYFFNEEEILSTQENPDLYNVQEIWPKKVAINKDYIKNYSFKIDVLYLIKTIF